VQTQNTHFGVKVKREHVVYSVFFQIRPQTAISMEKARRELSIDMAVRGPILKFNENTSSLFAFTPK